MSQKKRILAQHGESPMKAYEAVAPLGATEPPASEALTSEAVCHWLRGNGYEVVAEAIETGEQLARGGQGR